VAPDPVWVARASGVALHPGGQMMLPARPVREVQIARRSRGVGERSRVATHVRAMCSRGPVSALVGSSCRATVPRLQMGNHALPRLPTDPRQLAKLIDERNVEGSSPGTTKTFTIIGGCYRRHSPPPQLRAVLCRIASQLPIVHLFGPASWTPRRPSLRTVQEGSMVGAPPGKENRDERSGQIPRGGHDPPAI
jgi:hypothetical protein